MKGYFSELARHTGLRVGGGGPARAVGFSAATVAPAQPSLRSQVTGLDVDEVTFSSPSSPPAASANLAEQANVESISIEAVPSLSDRGNAQRLESADSDHIEPELQAPPIFESGVTIVEVSPANGTSSESRGPTRNPPAVEIEAGGIEQPRVVISEPTSSGSRFSESIELTENLSGREEPHEISEYATTNSFDLDQQTGQVDKEVNAAGRPSQTAMQSGTGMHDRVERQVTVRNYLKEISDWISTPAAAEEEPSPFAAATADEITRPLQRGADRASALPPDQLGAEAPAQQELSLSIGTIKIVIEEPRTPAPAPPVPAAKPDRTFERTAPAPTDLSRYYLNRW